MGVQHRGHSGESQTSFSRLTERRGRGAGSRSGVSLDGPPSSPYRWRVPLDRRFVPDLLASLQDVLGDRYQLEGELGHGGMATVYRAVDRKLGRPVAIKVLPPEFAAVVGSDRFQREITIASALQHANIVPLYDSGGSG